MELTYTFNSSDHRSAQWLNIKPRRSYAVVGVGLLVLTVWATWYAFFYTDLDWPPWVLSASLAYLFLHFCIFLPWHWNKMFRQQKSFHRESLLRVNNDGIEAQSENGAGQIHWSDFIRWKEDKHIFLLYLSDVSFLMIPTRIFHSDQMIEEFRDLISWKINGKPN